MITCKIIVDFKLSMIKMQIKGWFRAYFCMLSVSPIMLPKTSLLYLKPFDFFHFDVWEAS